RRRGRITQVVNRARTQFVGTVVREQRVFGLQIAPYTPARGIRLKRKKSDRWGEGDVVVARVLDWGTAFSPVFCEVIDRIGSGDDPRNDVQFVAQTHQLPGEFPPDVAPELARLTDQFIQQEGNRRTDLRDRRLLTIDPVGAQDHDDGISIRKLSNGWEVGVHIADVSAFVPLHSALDKEAFHRGTSVYLGDTVIPMLPEKLSAHLCSLAEGQDRLALSVLMEFDRKYRLQDWKVLPSLVRSHGFLSYQEAQKILDGEQKSPFRNDLDVLWKLARTLFRERSEWGSIDFDIPEPRIELAESGIPHTISHRERLNSHRIVEECMLLANRLIAERFGGKDGEFPFLYRIHEKPDEERMADFSRLLARLGVVPDRPELLTTPASVRDVLLKVEDSPHRNLIESLALRSMAKARYGTVAAGHFGLAFTHYTHFTSPIRRYPDLVVHRLVKAGIREETYPYDVSQLASVADWCSSREEIALKAERDYIKRKQLRWLNEQVDEVFPGVISGVIAAGIFVQLDESLAEGLVPAATLGPEFVLDEERYCWSNRKGKVTYTLGDPVQVRVVSVDLRRQRANFHLIAG
ncbi:MAG: VacB/RNase II family 3'-5' exoribonuclease, partial [Candidatus Neomarinimicrobiota bacterium]